VLATPVFLDTELANTPRRWEQIHLWPVTWAITERRRAGWSPLSISGQGKSEYRFTRKTSGLHASLDSEPDHNFPDKFRVDGPERTAAASHGYSPLSDQLSDVDTGELPSYTHTQACEPRRLCDGLWRLLLGKHVRVAWVVEVLYRPKVGRNWAVGVDATGFRQRGVFRQDFSFPRLFDPDRRHFTSLPARPTYNVLVKASAGDIWLAILGGILIVAALPKPTAITVGAYATPSTNVSSRSLVNGSFDKGIYFTSLSTPSFARSSQSQGHAGLEPLTRDARCTS